MLTRHFLKMRGTFYFLCQIFVKYQKENPPTLINKGNTGFLSTRSGILNFILFKSIYFNLPLYIWFKRLYHIF